MKEETRTLILYRLERAKESLDEANILLERGHTVVSGRFFIRTL